MLEFLELAGAVALLLWGIRMVQTGFSRLLGSKLERVLRRATQTRPKAFVVGAGSALMLQSSTAVILMISGFASAGMMTVSAALATVLGAELGASVAALILNLNVRVLSAPLIFIGYVMFLSSNDRLYKHMGRILIGLGLVLLALTLISGVTSALQHSDLFSVVMDTVARDSSLALTLMAILTWLIHSTLAVVLIIAQFVQDGTMDTGLALVLILGANLGGAMPALVAGWSQKGVGRGVVVANLGFRASAVVFGSVMLLFFNDLIITYLPEGAFGVVLFHFTLNLITGLLMLLFLPFIVRRAEPRMQAGGQKSFSIEDQGHRTIYLSANDHKSPDRAIVNASNEALHIADVVYKMLNYSVEAFDDQTLVSQIRALDDDIDNLHREALLYIVSIDEVQDEELQVLLRKRCNRVIDFMTNLEHIGDVIESSLMHLANNKQRQRIEFLPEQRKSIVRLHEELVEAFRLSQAVFTSQSPELAKELLSTKRRYRADILRIRRKHIEGLTGGVSESMEATQIFMDILRDMQRISSHLTAVAYQVLGQPKE